MSPTSSKPGLRRGGLAGLAIASLVLTPIIAIAPAATGVTTEGDIFISEIHYDNVGADVDEAIEVQAPVGTDLTAWQIILYNGSGGAPYDTKTLAGAVGETGVVVQYYPANGIQNGSPDGVALVDAEGAVVEFLSYEGVFTAVGGPADGLTSTDIGVEQVGTTPIGHSLQRIDGVWTGPLENTFGVLNSESDDNGNGDPDPDPDPEQIEVVINELYARGGSSGQPFTHKFVELYNPTDTLITLDGMSLQYKSATGASFSVQAQLSGSIAAGGYFLVQGGSNASNGVALPDPDLVAGGLNPGGSNGVVALVDGTTAITLPKGDVAGQVVDLIGTGTADTFETAVAANEGNNSTPLSWQRTEGVDTDNNSADFTMAFPTPQNSGGTNGGGDPDPDPDPTVVTIAEIQGTGETTPLDGQTVTTRGVVTGVYPEGGFNGAFIQTAGTGGNLESHTASHGIFVFGGTTQFANSVEIGEYIEVTGTAGEYFGLTQIAATTWGVLDETFEPVLPAEIGLPSVTEREAFESMLIAPQGDFTVTDTYHTNRFGWLGLAAGDTPLVQPTDVVRPGTQEYTALVAANADREIRMDDGSSFDWTNFNFSDHTIPVAYLDPEDPVRVEAAVEFSGPVILDFRRTVANEDSTWNFQPQTRLTGANADEVQPIGWSQTRPAAPAEVGGDVTLAAFNVLNYYTSLGTDEPGCQFYGDREGEPTTARNCNVRGAFDAENLERQTEKIVTAITTLDADVVALQEIENSISFVPGNEPADRDHALAGLVRELNAVAGDGVWEYVRSAPDFPISEDVIRNAFIYQADAVAPVGETTILIGDAAFHNAREPMAQEFAVVGVDGTVIEGADTFIAINNHFKSKGSGQGAGNEDIGDGQGASNADRVAQAHALVEFADAVATEAGTELVYLVGDFNSYTMEDPMMVFDDAGYTNIGQTMTDKSTYSFGSMVGSLDHILGSPEATAAVTGADIWNINAYEAIAFEYSRYNYNVTNFHDASPYRSSDHDPIIIGLDLVDEDLPPAPTDPHDLIEQLEESLEDYIRSGDVAGTFVTQLRVYLGLVGDHFEAGRVAMSISSLERFVRNLENPGRRDTLTDEARADLLAQAEELREALEAAISDARQLAVQLEQSVEDYTNSGDLSGSVVIQLRNSASLASNHIDRGNFHSAVNPIERFVRNLENPGRRDIVSDEARTDLLEQAGALLEAIS